MDIREHLSEIQATYADAVSALQKKDYDGLFLSLDRRAALFQDLSNCKIRPDKWNCSWVAEDSLRLNQLIEEEIKQIQLHLQAVLGSAHAQRAYATFAAQRSMARELTFER